MRRAALSTAAVALAAGLAPPAGASDGAARGATAPAAGIASPSGHRLEGRCTYVREPPVGVLTGYVVASGGEVAVSAFVRCEIVMPDSTLTAETWQAGPVAAVAATKTFPPQSAVLICETFAGVWLDGHTETTARSCHGS